MHASSSALGGAVSHTMAPKAKVASKAKSAPRRDSKKVDSKTESSVAVPKSPAKKHGKGTQLDPHSNDDTPSKAKRSWKDRRSVDEQVTRVLDNERLRANPREIWACATNAKGQTVEEFTAAHINNNKSSGAKIGSKFWNQLFFEFDFHDTVVLSQPDPSDVSTPDDAILEALHWLRLGNPVKATAVPLERYLARCPELGTNCFYGLLNAVQADHELPVHLACKAQVAVLSYRSRHRDLSV